MREVAVLGVGQSMFGKFPERSAESLGVEAASAAIKDAGIKARDVQVAYTARMLNVGTACQKILKEVGVTFIEMINVENACAGGSTAVRGLWKDIAFGLYDLGIAIGVESIHSTSMAGEVLAPEEDLEGELGMTYPGKFGLLSRRQMAECGATMEDFAHISVKNHHHGCLNPMAQYQKELTIEEVLKSRMIADPITLLQCCPQTDGAAAVVLCSMDVARKHTTSPVKIIGSALKSGPYDYKQKDIWVSLLGAQTAKEAYEMAGLGPKDIDLVELHDAFAPEEILRYEDLGLCRRGEGVQLLRSGATKLGGRVPVNPSGGLLSLGHPLSASGVRVVAEVALHLRGQAGKRQVEGAKVGLTHMLGGSVTGLEAGACGIHILAR